MKMAQEFPGIQVHWVRPDLYELGVTCLVTPSGNTVRSYGAERAIADLIRERKAGTVDAQLMQDVSEGTFGGGKKDLQGLTDMCSALGVRRELQGVSGGVVIMAIRNDVSLRGKIRAIAKERGCALKKSCRCFYLNICCFVSRKRRMLISSFSKVAC